MGRWEKLNFPWYQIQIINCSMCGRMIPYRIWLVDFHGEEKKFCGPECERLYLEYWLPTHGEK